MKSNCYTSGPEKLDFIITFFSSKVTKLKKNGTYMTVWERTAKHGSEKNTFWICLKIEK